MRARQTHVLKASIESEPGGFFVATPSPLDEQRARAPSVTQITVVTEIATRRMAPRDQAKNKRNQFIFTKSKSTKMKCEPKTCFCSRDAEFRVCCEIGALSLLMEAAIA